MPQPPSDAVARQALIRKVEIRFDEQLDEVADAVREGRSIERSTRLLAALNRMLARLEDREAPETSAGAP
jgi:hypothetical protein